MQPDPAAPDAEDPASPVLTCCGALVELTESGWVDQEYIYFGTCYACADGEGGGPAR